ncbi:MAG: hypothetical protein Q8R92_07145, partial [Deltaproteobacteria bacterium]|nr:hypothetical protein [Deltaproteobacteria bacterium]
MKPSEERLLSENSFPRLIAAVWYPDAPTRGWTDPRIRLRTRADLLLLALRRTGLFKEVGFDDELRVEPNLIFFALLDSHYHPEVKLANDCDGIPGWLFLATPACVGE